MTDDPRPKNEDATPERLPEVRSSGPHPQPQEDTRSPMARMQEMFAGTMQFGPPRHPLQEKITPEHITEILSIQREGMQRSQVDRDGQRKHHTTLCLIACGFVLALVGLLVFSGNAQMTEKILIGAFGVVAGAFGGYGYGTRKRE